MARVKICGLKTHSDCANAIASGADALGFVHYQPSSRHLELEQIQTLVRRLPPFVASVGLLVNPDESAIVAMQATGVHYLQIHGSGGGICAALGIAYIQAVAMRDAESIASVDTASCSAVLLDAYHESGAGGQGVCFNWELIPQELDKPLILAGGLNPDNIAQAIRATQPYAVDVSSGVESAPGVKDPELVRSFITNAKLSNQ